MSNKSKQHHDAGQRGAKKGVHQDWRAWVAVGLMLLAMAVYVLSDDEALQPNDTLAPVVPAAE